MNEPEKRNQSEATILCKSCGLCCSGHLFAWVKLRTPELGPMEALGVSVVRQPTQRGFSLPCPLWQGICTIYTSSSYPRACHTYKCKLLKRLLDATTTLPEALAVVTEAKEMIGEVESLLPNSANGNFRERLVERIIYLEKSIRPSAEDRKFQQKAGALVSIYKSAFGVKNLIDADDVT